MHPARSWMNELHVVDGVFRLLDPSETPQDPG